jgi:hypothetical protein
VQVSSDMENLNAMCRDKNQEITDAVAKYHEGGPSQSIHWIFLTTTGSGCKV